jgi:hypothetical protein
VAVELGGWPRNAYAVPSTYARAAGLVLAGLVLAAVVVRTALAWRIPTPWIMIDELVYSELAKSFAERGELLIRDLPSARFSILYPVAIAPAWLVDSTATSYGLAKVINGVLMSLAAVPAYLWARRLLSPLYSLLAAGLVLLLPAYVYTGTLMTENAFFPTFVLATYAFALALERPTLATQAFALVAAGVAIGVRVQGIVLVAILVCSTGIKVLFDLRGATLRSAVRPHLPMLGAIAGLSLAYVALKVAQGASLASGLGAYSGVSSAGYAWDEAVRWTVWHAGELALVVGVVPLAALIVLAGLAVSPGLPSPAERAFVAVGVTATVFIVAQVGIFASRFVPRIEERNMFHVVPILLLALVVWIARGLPRPLLLAALAAGCSAALLAAIPLDQLLNPTILSDTFGLLPLLRVDSAVSGGLDTVRALMIAGGCVAALAFLLLPRRAAAVALPLVLAGYFVISTNSVLGRVEDYSASLRRTLPANADWVDDRVGTRADVPTLYGASPDPFREAVGLWQLEFWNRSVDGPYDLGVGDPAGIPRLQATFDRTTGTIVAPGGELAPAGYVVAPNALDLDGRPLVADAEHTLYAVEPPVQVETSVDGVYTDGWMESHASYDRYTGSAGTLMVTVSRRLWRGPRKPGEIFIEIGPLMQDADGLPEITQATAVRTGVIRSRSSQTFRIPTPKPPFRATVYVEPTFSPADDGQGDAPQIGAPRQLGAQVAFGFKPARAER